MVDFRVQNRSKTNQKSIRKAIGNKMEVGMDFGWLLDGFLMDFGAKLGGHIEAKLSPKSENMGYQDDDKKPKTNLEPQWHAGGSRWYAVKSGPGP